MKQIITIIFLSVVLISCSRDNESENDDTLITNIKLDLNKSGNWINLNAIDFHFEYDNQTRLKTKIGGFLRLSPNTGYDGRFSNDIYTSLIYNNDKVTVENFSSSPNFIVSLNSNYYTLNNLNQIIEREIPNPDNNYWDKKQVYEYLNNKLVEIKTSLPNMPYFPDDPNDYIQTYSEKFYYDSNGNLSKTEYFEMHNGINIGEKIVRTFENYDTSSNPTKRFYLLDDYFYRSISKNNFRKYTEIRYYYDNIISSNEKNWAFNYDSNGNIIVN